MTLETTRRVTATLKEETLQRTVNALANPIRRVSERQASGNLSLAKSAKTGFQKLASKQALFARVLLYNSYMDRIACIKYFDAYYLLIHDYKETKLLIHEAHGYLSETNDAFVLEFIKNNSNNSEELIKGLLIPKKALVSQVQNHTNQHLFQIPSGVEVSILWQDIVYVANLKRDELSLMETTGTFVGQKDHCVVIRNPKTKKIHPLPKEKHPPTDPTFYIIPMSFVTSLRVLT
jgi:hypothetical protein